MAENTRRKSYALLAIAFGVGSLPLGFPNNAMPISDFAISTISHIASSIAVRSWSRAGSFPIDPMFWKGAKGAFAVSIALGSTKTAAVIIAAEATRSAW